MAETTEKAPILQPILGALVIPIIIGLWMPSLIDTFWNLLRLIVVMIPIIIFYRANKDWSSNNKPLAQAIWDNIRPVPPGLVYGTDLKEYGSPRVTVALVVINSLFFFALPEEVVDAGIFFPYGDPSLTHSTISLFTSAFLHADFSHLSGNMIFLLAFGGAVEPRIGSKRFALLLSLIHI